MLLSQVPTVHEYAQGGATDGVSITSFGKGQLVGTTYAVPAHGQIDVDFQLQLQCITPDQVKAMNELIRGLLDASHQHEYDNLNKTEVSGGLSFFSFFSGGLKATTTNTNHTMDKWGLSEEHQKKIINEMMKLANKMNKFNYKGTIYNKEYDYSVSGNLFGIVMDCTVQQGSSSTQFRAIAPAVHLADATGTATLPIVGKLY
jgi:hypothetical protein